MEPYVPRAVIRPSKVKRIDAAVLEDTVAWLAKEVKGLRKARPVI